jgi:hypothetical protein
MALNLEQLEAAFTRLGSEVGETGDQVRKYVAQIADLKAQIPSPEVQAKLDGITAGLTAQADALDALQEKVENPPTDPNAPGFRGRK